jgi:hypothetical protein
VRPPRLELAGDKLAHVRRTIREALGAKPQVANGPAIPAK